MKIFRTDPDRFGIRARLLTLLLPGILGLLVLDSVNDYRALREAVQGAHDEALLESVATLRQQLSLAPDGSFRMPSPAAATAAPAASDTPTTLRRVHVGLLAAQTPAGAAPDERTLLGEADLPSPPADAAPPDAGTALYDGLYDGRPVRVAALRQRVTDGRGAPHDLLIQVANSVPARGDAQAASLRQQLLRDARMLLVVTLLVWLGVTWSLHPLERLRKSVLAQDKGPDLRPLDTSGVPHEVAPLVDAVNQHLASYRALLDEQSQFLADASHQLRTPLAIMLTQAGVALREKDTGLLHETLKAMVVQIARSRRLCEQLLSLAHASDSAPPVDAPRPVDLGAIARDVVLQYLSLAHEKKQDLGWVDAGDTGPADSADGGADIPADLGDEDFAHAMPHGDDDDPGAVEAGASHGVQVLARSAELHEALSNLVHNAIVYTPVGGRITVMVDTQDGFALAEVRDDGPGIPAARRAGVFERFHHGGSTRADGHRGAGLGMAIALAYARRNGGDILLEDAGQLAAPATGDRPAATGLRAIVRLPLAPSAAA